MLTQFLDGAGNATPNDGQPHTTNTTTSNKPTPTTTTTTTTTAPSTAPEPPEARVRWQGTLTLGGYGGQGGGWYLDGDPPTPAITGDVYFGSANEIHSQTAIVPWNGPAPPRQDQCVEALNTQLGQHVVDVQVGTMACEGTTDGRAGYVTVTRTPAPGELSESMTVDATVWDHR